MPTFSTDDRLSIGTDGQHLSLFSSINFRSVGWCHIGMNLLSKSNHADSIKEPRSGFVFPGELCLRPQDRRCPRITGVGYVVQWVLTERSWSLMIDDNMQDSTEETGRDKEPGYLCCGLVC